ncbi:collagen alpha-2(I) chain-like [Equus quagga]|uniref:collagen alpha-2(I) chain-like n=1 Tax=Equus quagga TaxID=89248 RepID=UPI001EE212B0|nr:collagen alpha-2(I) chain-like [Equus quagga]
MGLDQSALPQLRARTGLRRRRLAALADTPLQTWPRPPSFPSQMPQNRDHSNQTTRWVMGSPQGPQEAPRVQGPGPGAATEDVEALGPAFYPKRSFKPDSQGLQAALPASRRGIAGHLLPPIGGREGKRENRLLHKTLSRKTPRRRVFRTTTEKSHYTLRALVLAPPTAGGSRRSGIQLVPSEGSARPRWRWGPPGSLRVWERKEAPLAPFSLPARRGHGPAKSPLPSGRRCRVADPRSEGNAGLAAPSRPRLQEGLRRVAASPRSGAPSPRPVGAARRGAGGRRLPGAGGRRGTASVTAAAGLRRKPGLRRGGAAAPGEAQGSGPRRARRCSSGAPAAAAPARHRWPLVSFSALPARGGARPCPRVSVRLRVCHLHTRSPSGRAGPGSGVGGSRVCHLQDPEPPTPASRRAGTSRMGPCFPSRTTRAPPLPAIFLGGHLQRFRGDFLPAGTKPVTPLTEDTRGTDKLSEWRGTTTTEKPSVPRARTVLIALITCQPLARQQPPKPAEALFSTQHFRLYLWQNFLLLEAYEWANTFCTF